MTLPEPTRAALLLDAATVALISIGVVTAAQRLMLMTALVPTLLLGRLLVLARFGHRMRPGWSLRAEIGLLAACTVVGAGNDYNTVVRHSVYAYCVPCWWPALSTVPLWMLIYWGMILRLLLTLARWPALGASCVMERRARRHSVEGKARLPLSGAARLLFILALVVVTRQLVYRLWSDALWSWLPMALALGAAALLLRPTDRQWRLMALLAVGGPLVEMAYVHAGGLHRYALGWLGGVPLWIALWWPLGALLLDELARPLELFLGQRWPAR